MSVTISKESNNCLVVNVAGVFSYKDLEAVQNAAKEEFQSGVKINCLILAGQFSGWGKDGNWGDLTFLYESDAMIRKIAVVAEDKLWDELKMFLGVNYRQAEVDFFSQQEEQKARRWLLDAVE